MTPLRVLITNGFLDARAGTELYVRDVAMRLSRRGHRPTVYTPAPGAVARELAEAGVPVVDDPAALADAPDLIHGHHHAETMTALLRFPGVPAVYVCHDRTSWLDRPPRFPRVVRYVAVDDNCRDRVVEEAGVSPERVAVVPNGVDLDRFRPRGPLPGRPRRALVFSNSAAESNYLPAVRAACAAAGVAVDVAGAASGRPCDRPEWLLAEYDVVFAKARCALEALAVGAAVVLCDARGAGPMVTSAEYDRLRRLNLGMRTLTQPVSEGVLLSELGRYDPADAAAVSDRVRATAGLDATVDGLLGVYREVLDAAAAASCDVNEEMRLAAGYLRWQAASRGSAWDRESENRMTAVLTEARAWASQAHRETARQREDAVRLAGIVDVLREERAAARAEAGAARAEAARLERTLAELRGSSAVKAHEALVRLVSAPRSLVRAAWRRVVRY